MPAKLILTIVPDCDKEVRLSYSIASALQGVLMETIPTEVAGALHTQGLKPYSQYVHYENGDCKWIINSLTEEAFNFILRPLQNASFSMFHLEVKSTNFIVKNKQLETISSKELSHLFYSQDSGRYFHIRFLTPTAFKSDGKYVFYPQIRQVVRSLMAKHAAVFEDSQEVDEDMLESILSKTEIVKYDLKSTVFHLEGVKIPSFLGDITLRVAGAQTLANYMKMLVTFGEFSGIGIKTAIGMGAIRLMEDKED